MLPSLENKKVLVRVDFNVPQDKEGNILDNSRIRAALPTICHLIDQGSIVILMSHLGRPDGAPNAKYSLKPVQVELERLLGQKVEFASQCVGKEVEAQVSKLKPKEVLLLENLRFHAAEENPELDPTFAENLAKLGDFYIDDAFGCAHRNHASIVAVPSLMKGKVAPGFLLEKEIAFLGDALKNPKRPFLALIGGAKISSKIGVLKSLLNKVDVLAIGGAMAYTFLKAMGYRIGNSLVEDAFLEEAKAILEAFKKAGKPLLLPQDVVITDGTIIKTCTLEEGIPNGFEGLDIGPSTVALFSLEIKKAKTIFWNGPMGVFEKEPFANGTYAIAHAFATSGAITIAGGGETISALAKTPDKEKISHLSTGGGAALEYLEWGTLPGIEVLTSSSSNI